MKIFISYPHSSAGKKLEADLAEKLKEHGITAWTSDALAEASPGQHWSKIAANMHSCDKFLLVIDSTQPKTDAQDFEWRSSLEATWSDPNKRLIPILIGNVEMPNFIRSAAPAGEAIQTIRIDPKRGWNQAADTLIQVLEDRSGQSTVTQNYKSTEEDRAQQRKRLDYVRSTAQAFKPAVPPLKDTI